MTKDATFDLNVLVLDYIEVTTMPTDTEFTEEDPYDYDGLVITAYFEDGSSRIITDACTYDPAPGTPAVYGTDTVNVTYAPSAASSASTSFAITVKKKAVPTVKAIPSPAPEPALKTCDVKVPLLKRGNTGNAVKNAQTLLISKGYACGGSFSGGREIADGDFGPTTEKSVKSFQDQHKLSADGIIGSDTWKALLTE